MLGISSRFDKTDEENLVLERLGVELRAFLSRFTRELNDQGFLKAFPGTHQVTLATLSHNGLTYCLVRIPSGMKKGLTLRQRIIALHVAEGLPNKEIGRRLGIRTATVASHISRIFRKLEVDSRVALARYSILFA